jgi:neutral ceramidase
MNAPTKTGLTVGAASVNITPPLEVGLLMSSVKGRWAPFTSVRSALKARVMVLACGKERVALVSLDLLGLTSLSVGGWNRFKRGLSQAAGNVVRSERIVITCTHTHNAPESVGITDLYKTAAFQLWLEALRQKIGRAIRDAAAAARPGTVALASTELNDYSLQRRISTPAGIVMSDSVQPIAAELFSCGPIDRRVQTLSFRDQEGAPIATLVHASCHPVHEMCLQHISADFPGEFCAAWEASCPAGLPLFLNGAAGDINPPTVSEGPDCARRHGQALAEAVGSAVGNSKLLEVATMRFCTRKIGLPMRSLKGGNLRRTCSARLGILRLGPMAILFVPGEIFVETALAIEASSPFKKTLIVGFAESSIGYVPPRRAFEEGGYEIGPGKWSYLQAGAESILRSAAVEFLKDCWKLGDGRMEAGWRRSGTGFQVIRL